MTRIPDCARLMFGSWVLKEIWITVLSSALVGMLISSSKFFLFFKRSSFKLRCETVIGIVLCYSHQECCLLYYLGEINRVAFTCTSFILNLYTSVFGCGYGFRFEQKFWQIDGFGEKKARIRGFAYPYSPPSSKYLLSRDKIGNFP